MYSIDSSGFRYASPSRTSVFQVPGKSQDSKFTAAMAIPAPKSTPASTRFEPPSPKAKVSPATTIATRDSSRAIVLVNACSRTLTEFSQGDWPLTCANAADARSETERKRRRLTGASGRRTSFGRLSSLPASSFQMTRPRPHPDSKATSRRTWLGGTVGVGSRKLKFRRATAKLPPGATRVRAIAGGRVLNVVSELG